MTRLCVSVEFSLQKSNEMEVEYTLRGWTREGKKKTRRTSRDSGMDSIAWHYISLAMGLFE